MEWIKLNNEVKIIKEGKYQLSKDEEAIDSYLREHVYPNMVRKDTLYDKIKYMLENEYWSNELFSRYKYEDIKAFFKYAYDFDFKFKSYMSVSKFYQSYSLKTNDGKKYLETYEDRVVLTAMFFGLLYSNHKKSKLNKMVMLHIENMMKQKYQPATPTFLNTGVERGGEMVSCFIININDSTEGINYANSASSQLSRIGGGVGLSLTDIRAMGESIKGIEGCAGGILGLLKILEEHSTYFNQNGKRDGSFVAYLSVMHPNIVEFLDTKKVNADEKFRLKKLSLGVVIPDVFMKLAKEGKDYYTFYPKNLKDVLGLNLSEIDMNEWYEKLVSDDRIKKKKLNPREILTKIAQIQQESGYPYLLFIDNANRQNPLKDLGKITASNLCSEILQISTESVVAGYDERKKNKWGRDISCNLGSLNIVNVMENKDVENSIGLAVDALNQVVNGTDIYSVPTVQLANRELRSIGLGVMNLHGYLAKNSIMYASKSSIEFVNVFMAMVRYYAIKRSMKIAKDNPSTVFKGFGKSEYAKGENGNVFKQYIQNEHLPKSKKVKELFEGIELPTSKDWKKLSKDVAENGMANSLIK